MTESSKGPDLTVAPRGAGGPVKFVLSLLASLRFALAVVVAIALACIAGTLIPQEQQVIQYLERHPDAHRLMEVLTSLGLTRVFYSWWFVALLSILAASLAVCTARRYGTLRRTTGAARTRVAGSFVTHVSLLLVLAGGVMRVVWGQKGTIAFHEGETVDRVAGSASPFSLPFSVRLATFELEFYESPEQPAGARTDMLVVRWAEKDLQVEFPVKLAVEYPVVAPDAPADADPSFTVSVLRYEPDFTINGMAGGVTSRSDAPNNPAIHVSVAGGGNTNTQWVFARFPDFGSHGGKEGAPAPHPLQFRFDAASAMGRRASGPIKAFKSTVEVLEGGEVVRTVTVAVNSPFTHRGYTFYQSSYNAEDLTWTALQVVRDPGVPVVYAGFILMMVGLTMVFCVGPMLGSQHPKKGGTP